MMVTNKVIFKDLIRDIQAFQSGKLGFKELKSKYSKIDIRVFNLASNWILTAKQGN